MLRTISYLCLLFDPGEKAWFFTDRFQRCERGDTIFLHANQSPNDLHGSDGQTGRTVGRLQQSYSQRKSWR